MHKVRTECSRNTSDGSIGELHIATGTLGVQGHKNIINKQISQGCRIVAYLPFNLGSLTYTMQVGLEKYISDCLTNYIFKAMACMISNGENVDLLNTVLVNCVHGSKSDKSM